MARRRKNGRRRTYRRRSRNSWPNDHVRHVAAGKKGSKRRKARKASKAGKRKSSKRARRRNRGRSRRRNGLTLTRPLSALGSAFNLKTLSQAGVMAAGAVGNSYLAGAISGLDFMPGMLKSGPGSYAVDLASAGLLGAGVGMIAPKYSGSVLAGAVMATVARALREFVLPKLGLKGMDDYLTPGNAASAVPLGYMDDYLTPGNAASAVPLGYMSGEDTVSEELASF